MKGQEGNKGRDKVSKGDRDKSGRSPRTILKQFWQRYSLKNKDYGHFQDDLLKGLNSILVKVMILAIVNIVLIGLSYYYIVFFRVSRIYDYYFFKLSDKQLGIWVAYALNWASIGTIIITVIYEILFLKRIVDKEAEDKEIIPLSIDSLKKMVSKERDRANNRNIETNEAIISKTSDKEGDVEPKEDQAGASSFRQEGINKKEQMPELEGKKGLDKTGDISDDGVVKDGATASKENYLTFEKPIFRIILMVILAGVILVRMNIYLDFEHLFIRATFTETQELINAQEYIVVAIIFSLFIIFEIFMIILYILGTIERKLKIKEVKFIRYERSQLEGIESITKQGNGSDNITYSKEKGTSDINVGTEIASKGGGALTKGEGPSSGALKMEEGEGEGEGKGKGKGARSAVNINKKEHNIFNTPIDDLKELKRKELEYKRKLRYLKEREKLLETIRKDKLIALYGKKGYKKYIKAKRAEEEAGYLSHEGERDKKISSKSGAGGRYYNKTQYRKKQEWKAKAKVKEREKEKERGKRKGREMGAEKGIEKRKAGGVRTKEIENIKRKSKRKEKKKYDFR
ncbi:MAG: hypothetical protein ACTSU2_12025 [Promethearchaeota archaeon]